MERGARRLALEGEVLPNIEGQRLLVNLSLIGQVIGMGAIIICYSTDFASGYEIEWDSLNN
jgi:hypothetical protein